jgi:hypothetical protein
MKGEDVRSKHKQNWINHLERMDNTRLPKHALNYKPPGRRNRGRPRKRWQRVEPEEVKRPKPWKTKKKENKEKKEKKKMMMMMMNGEGCRRKWSCYNFRRCPKTITDRPKQDTSNVSEDSRFSHKPLRRVNIAGHYRQFHSFIKDLRKQRVFTVD